MHMIRSENTYNVDGVSPRMLQNILHFVDIAIQALFIGACGEIAIQILVVPISWLCIPGQLIAEDLYNWHCARFRFVLGLTLSVACQLAGGAILIGLTVAFTYYLQHTRMDTPAWLFWLIMLGVTVHGAAKVAGDASLDRGEDYKQQFFVTIKSCQTFWIASPFIFGFFAFKPAIIPTWIPYTQYTPGGAIEQKVAYWRQIKALNTSTAWLEMKDDVKKRFDERIKLSGREGGEDFIAEIILPMMPKIKQNLADIERINPPKDYANLHGEYVRQLKGYSLLLDQFYAALKTHNEDEIPRTSQEIQDWEKSDVLKRMANEMISLGMK